MLRLPYLVGRKRLIVFGSLFFLLIIIAVFSYILFTKPPEETSSSATLINSTILDSRIGTVLATSAYPDRHVQGDLLQYASKKAYDKGFRSIEVWLAPNVCTSHVTKKDLYPYGFYQTTKWCNPDGTFKKSSLAWLAEQPEYTYVFDLPFETYLLTLDSLNEKALTQKRVARSERIASKEEIALLYNDAYELTKYLSSTYSGSNKTFILVFGNELEWRVTTKSNCQPNCNKVRPDPMSVRNAILWVNTADDAIKAALEDFPPFNLKIYSSTEINHVLTKEIPQSALTQVIPNIHTDLIGWSAHETKTQDLYMYSDDPGGAAVLGLNRIAKYMPDSEAFGNKNVYISEIGINENLTTSAQQAKFGPFLKSALAWGAKYVVYWSFYESECDSGEPTEEQRCTGLWIVKPDGTLGNVYRKVLLPSFSVSNSTNKSKATKANASLFVSQKVPSSMKAGRTYWVEITFKNTGKSVWKKDKYLLGYLTKFEAQERTWTRGRVALGKDVKPGGKYTFKFNVKAPAIQGSYNFEFQLLARGIEWFGESSPSTLIRVVK